MGIIVALVVGLVVGALAKLLMPGRDPGGIFITALLGMGGSMLATLLGRAVGWYRNGDETAGLVASVIGAVLVLAAYRLLQRRRIDS